MDALRSFLKWIRRHWLLSFVLGAALVGLIVGLRVWMRRSEGLVTSPLVRGQIVQSVYGIGTVIANRTFQIKPGVTGHLDEIYVKEGDFVKKGARLFILDGVSWRAPFDGTVTHFPTKFAETVFGQTAILTLVDMKDRYLVVSLEQQGALQVRPGQKVKMSFDTIREQSYEGIVRSVYSNESNFLARIDISDLPDRILPGMTCDVAIEIQEKKNVLLVPVAALQMGRVWVKRGNAMPQLVEVKTGIVDKEQAEVVSGGLEEGDRLLIKEQIRP